MFIRSAALDDLPQMLAIYTCARKFMTENGNSRQWGPNSWPPEDVLRNDITAGRSYIVEDGKGCIAGTFVYIFGEDIEPNYRHIENGSWKYPGPYGVIHRLAASGTAKGVGSSAINWALRQNGHLRIDTHPDNKVMQNLAAKHGFEYCGIIHVPQDSDPRFAYEKVL